MSVVIILGIDSINISLRNWDKNLENPEIVKKCLLYLQLCEFKNFVMACFSSKLFSRINFDDNLAHLLLNDR